MNQSHTTAPVNQTFLEIEAMILGSLEKYKRHDRKNDGADVILVRSAITRHAARQHTVCGDFIFLVRP